MKINNIKKINKLNKNKRGLSEMVSYVLLIVIAIGLSTGVYAWLKGYLPSANPRETCNADVSLVIQDYTCNTSLSKIKITIKNQGYFNVNGFFISGSNSTNESILPINKLRCLGQNCLIMGQYDFKNTSFKPQETLILDFFYETTKPLERIQIQPYVKPTKPNPKTNLLLCEKIVNQKIEGCN